LLKRRRGRRWVGGILVILPNVVLSAVVVAAVPSVGHRSMSIDEITGVEK
jgi:hypothetical protein